MPDPIAPEVIALSGVTKSFGGVTALRGVDFSLAAGEIHGLVGENGAGKSTLMKIIAGVHTGYLGEMRIDRQPVHFASPRDARAAGIGMVHQELAIMPDLSVAENVHMGALPLRKSGLLDWPGMRRGAAEHLANLGIDIDPRTRMGDLPLGLQQLVEIARVLFSGARIIILDEPTSALAPPEVERLFSVLRRLRDAGRSIIFISHFLDDVLAICDRVTVFRNGHAIATEPCPRINKRWIIDRMIGAGHEALEETYLTGITLRSKPDAPVVLQVEHLDRPGTYQDVSLRARAGEVLGIYGFLGSGQLELAHTLFGRLRASRGRIALDGKPVRLASTTQARRAGIAFLPESRRMMLFGSEPVFKNVTISILDRIGRVWLRPRVERKIAADHAARLRIRPPDVQRALRTLSGGNQQKVALAKWLTHLPRVLVLSEPTRGMDVGAKDDVTKIVRGLVRQDIAVIVVSAEPETILSLADRILVMKKGRIVREFADERVSKDRLLEAS
ncbi:sugar ABC transporter ATP-binding protein [Rhodopila globiformis]|uniref:ABC transporter ATP-binding protein n=1 Tax=Rhodopila globiformis TaxID=1071 RepID=A0A2S6MWE5_RHOGL|nr:sugar ABC transporter ATP-binding protein [Rhodopila globiformis]PPQ26681.1 ABC transporter ATP-binding protein [Rhodopila globiformis]